MEESAAADQLVKPSEDQGPVDGTVSSSDFVLFFCGPFSSAVLLQSASHFQGSPPYISELITVKPKSTYGLRSSNSTLLLPPTQKMLPTLGARSFAAAAPALWNKLPADIRNVASLNSFKKSIKTFLFNESL